MKLSDTDGFIHISINANGKISKMKGLLKYVDYPYPNVEAPKVITIKFYAITNIRRRK